MFQANRGRLARPCHSTLELFKLEEDDQDTFYVHGALAEQKDNFKVLVEPKALHGFPVERIRQYSECSDSSPRDETQELHYRPALTKCRVLARGRWRSQPVSKIQLEPWTGRR